MPRRRNRFSRLDAQFRDSGGTAAAGSRLAGYIAWKKGERKVTINQKLTSAERKRYAVAILPFALTPPGTPTAADRYQAPITQYSNGQKSNLGLTSNRLGHGALDTATVKDPNFYPALLRVFVATSTTPTTPISGITGKEYTRIPGRNYSFPFGRTITSVEDKKTGLAETALDQVDELDVRDSLITELKANATTNGVRSISYEPEVFRVGRSVLQSAPGV